MTRSRKVLGFLLVALVGIYGCTKGPVPSSGSSEGRGSAATEARVHKLETDLQTNAVARDVLRQKLTAAEDQQARLQKQLDETKVAAAREKAALTAERTALTAERNALRTDLKTRTTERDTLQTQFVGYLDDVAERAAKQKAALLGTLPAPSISNTSQALPTTPATRN